MTRFRRRLGLRTAIRDDAFLLGGAVPPVLLRGKAATTAVPMLLGALDGVRDTAGLASAIGRPERQVDAMLSLLRRHGAVEIAGHAAESGSPEAAFFALAAGYLADPRSGDALRARVSRTPVEIVGTDPVTAVLTPRRAEGAPLYAGSDVEGLTERWRAGAAVLPVRSAGNELVIGPVSRAGSGLCPRCLAAGTAEPGALPQAHHALAAALLAARLPMLLARDPGPDALHLDLESGRTRSVPRRRRPGCADPCGPAARNASTSPLGQEKTA
ncbi:hypothetical protein F9C11_26665 [Amycolatopsis sp. VS8301801F10]|uniref:hypothetical protein n=1 Tax=Amycolatopsis sp. VS8301801F10 TaxID=2652442 RepID=UPI0038FD3CC2